MTRIAVFLPSLNGGGAERVMTTVANAFASRGYLVDLVLAKAEGPCLDYVSSSVRIVDLNVDRVMAALMPLRSYIKKERPQVILSALGHANNVAILSKLLSSTKLRVVVSERGTISEEYKVAKGFFSKMNFNLIPILYRFADGVCSVSQLATDDLVKFAGIDPGKVTTIYNPFDHNLILRKAAEPCVHPWFSEKGAPIIVAAGRLNDSKDFSTLIHAFATLRRTRDLRLLILGEGELRSELELLASSYDLGSEHFCMPGFVDNPYSYLSRSSIFVLSSCREGLPSVLIEAMICGVPVVSTNCLSGPSEILEGGLWGKMVAVGDVNAMAHAIETVLETPSNSLPDVRQRALFFQHDQAIDAYLKLLGVT